jgi:hypothetical protein
MDYFWFNGIKEEDEDLFIEKTDGLFHIGQSYEDIPAKTIYCKKCGGNKFNVGVGSYFAGIKCITCGWEICIHSG